MIAASTLVSDWPAAGRRPPHRGASGPRPRFLLYSHDGVGLGHVRRNLILAGAILSARPDASVLVATGVEEFDTLSAPGAVDVLRLPGMRKVANDCYAARRLALSDDEILALRAGLLATAVERFRPDVLLADKHPGGARGELVPALELLRVTGGRAAVGLRDVLDAPAQARREWHEGGGLADVMRFHDLVLVYGQAQLLDPIQACGLPASARARVRYCGYVVARAPAPAPTPPSRVRPLILAAVGGGEDGDPVLAALLVAARGAPWDVVAVAGPQADAAQHDDLQRLAARAQAQLVPSVRDLGRHVGTADAVVCMGGYNSLAEVLAAAVPAVCVPRISPRTEQLVRAEAFAARGLLQLVHPGELRPGRLRHAVEVALATDRRSLEQRIAAVIDLDGSRRAAQNLLDLAGCASVARQRPMEVRR